MINLIFWFVFCWLVMMYIFDLNIHVIKINEFSEEKEMESVDLNDSGSMILEEEIEEGYEPS